SFYWRISGRANLEFYAALYNLEAKTRVEELLKLFNIDYADKRFDTYSSGMKRKLAIIRALLHDPEILLLDEPTRSLDYNSSLELRNLIKSQKEKGKTIILATHNLDEAKELADEVVILNKGKIKINKHINEAQELEETYKMETCE
ncbi:ATP-binding cassette domain-containing protein, partial [Candidatus Margulisiibacteriota bacterium]